MKEMPLEEFLKEFKLLWHVGQHATLIGTTGDGKTVLAKHLYALRKYVVVVATKASDESLDNYGRQFHKITKWPPDWHQEKVLFWKKPDRLGDFSGQRDAIIGVLNNIYKHGGWTVGLDDVLYLAKTLRLEKELQMAYTQFRSQGISLVGLLQRPFWAPLEVTNQASHVLLFGLKDENDVKRVAEAQGIKRYDVVKAVEQLHMYDFAWIRKGASPVIVRHKQEEEKK